MFNLDNISVEELFQLEERQFNEYFRLSQVMKHKKKFKGIDAKVLGKLTFGEVSELKRIFRAPSSEGMIRAFNIVYKSKRAWVLSSDVVTFFYALNWIGESLNKLVVTENKLLATETDPWLEQAGVSKLQKFGELPAMINLAERFATRPDGIETWPYNLVLSILAYDNVSGQIQVEYNELKRQHNGRS